MKAVSSVAIRQKFPEAFWRLTDLRELMQVKLTCSVRATNVLCAFERKSAAAAATAADAAAAA